MRTFTLVELEAILARRMERAQDGVEHARALECWGLVTRYEAIHATCIHILKELRTDSI